jgi:hypothetical protein
MKSVITFCIGLAVTILCTVQYFMSFAPIRLIGVAVGLFFIIFGWKIGWTRNRKFTALLGHITLIAGCLVCAFAAYQIPFLTKPPTLLEVFDMPLFWGIFTIFGGQCMITHSHCSCTIRMYDEINCKNKNCANQ